MRTQNENIIQNRIRAGGHRIPPHTSMDLNSLPWGGSAGVLQTFPLSFHSPVETVGESKLDINASLYIPSPLNYPIFLALKRSNLTCANGFKSVALLFQIKINMETVLASK
jgi:hypothetical protein